MEDMALSVVLPTYSGDDPDALSSALESLISQTRPPDEIVLVKDGPLTPALDAAVGEFETAHPSMIAPLQLPENRGLGGALRAGVEAASHSFVARQDADDISVPERFERQLSFLCENPEVDVVGGFIREFDDEMVESVGERRVPTAHEDIKHMSRFRCPMNHVTVMFRREVVLEAGNYRAVDRMEDYGLWVRMLLDGAAFANLPEVLTKVRAGNEMYGRRGGLEYAREEVRIQREFYRQGYISLPMFLFNVMTRTGFRLVPDRVRGFVYESLTRV